MPASLRLFPIIPWLRRCSHPGCRGNVFAYTEVGRLFSRSVLFAEPAEGDVVVPDAPEAAQPASNHLFVHCCLWLSACKFLNEMTWLHGLMAVQRLSQMEMRTWQMRHKQRSQQAIMWPATAKSGKMLHSSPDQSSEAQKQGEHERDRCPCSLLTPVFGNLSLVIWRLQSPEHMICKHVLHT